MSMKVILLEDVKGLGVKGEVVDVSEGHARNFLFPQHMGVEASEEKLREKEAKEKSVAKKSKKADEAEKKLAKAVDGAEVILKEKADGGKLYGSVGPKEISKGLKGLGHKVKPELISFEAQKEVGTYEASVNFASGFDATLTIIIEAK